MDILRRHSKSSTPLARLEKRRPTNMLRKTRPIQTAARRSVFTIEGGLLATMAIALGIAAAEMNSVTVASVTSQAGTLFASSPATDNTPVGSIGGHRKSVFDPVEEPASPKQVQSPFGLRSAR